MTYPKGYDDPKEEARYKKAVRMAWILGGIYLGLTILIMIVFPETRSTFKEIGKILRVLYGV